MAPKEGDPLVLNVPAPKSVEGKVLQFSRATMPERLEACRFCHVLTPRVLVSRVKGDPSWDRLPCCDWCFRCIRRLSEDFRGL
jgi:hypothetical protein